MKIGRAELEMTLIDKLRQKMKKTICLCGIIFQKQ